MLDVRRNYVRTSTSAKYIVNKEQAYYQFPVLFTRLKADRIQFFVTIIATTLAINVNILKSQ